MSVRRTGDWRRAEQLLARGAKALARGVDRALLQEGHALRAEIVGGLDRQAPGGTPLRPLTELTLAARRLRRFAGTKALVRTAELRNALAVLRRGASSRWRRGSGCRSGTRSARRRGTPRPSAAPSSRRCARSSSSGVTR